LRRLGRRRQANRSRRQLVECGGGICRRRFDGRDLDRVEGTVGLILPSRTNNEVAANDEQQGEHDEQHNPRLFGSRGSHGGSH